MRWLPPGVCFPGLLPALSMAMCIPRPAGKTHTMMGSPEEPGMIPRAMDQVGCGSGRELEGAQGAGGTRILGEEVSPCAVRAVAASASRTPPRCPRLSSYLPPTGPGPAFPPPRCLPRRASWRRRAGGIR